MVDWLLLFVWTGGALLLVSIAPRMPRLVYWIGATFLIGGVIIKITILVIEAVVARPM